jgi:hypothetical protein
MKSSVATEANAGTAIATRPARVASTPETRIHFQRSPSARRMSSSSEPIESGPSGEPPLGVTDARSFAEAMGRLSQRSRRLRSRRICSASGTRSAKTPAT